MNTVEFIQSVLYSLTYYFLPNSLLLAVQPRKNRSGALERQLFMGGAEGLGFSHASESEDLVAMDPEQLAALREQVSHKLYALNTMASASNHTLTSSP